MLLSKKAFLRLKLASLAFEESFISNWFGAQIKFTWGSIKVYGRFTSDSNEAQFDFFQMINESEKGLRRSDLCIVMALYCPKKGTIFHRKIM